MKTAKRIKSKAQAGMELVGTGAALTGGAMLLEEVTKPKVAPRHDNVYVLNMKLSQVRMRLYRLRK